MIEDLIHRYLPAVYNFIYRLTGDTEVTSDLVQETFLKIWRGRQHYNPEKDFRPWLFRVARNTVIDWLRKKRSTPLSALGSGNDDWRAEENIPDPAPLPEKLFEQKELEQKLEQALGQLSLDQRAVVLLHHQENLTFAEISAMVGKPLNTVKSQYRRALLTLRHQIDQ